MPEADSNTTNQWKSDVLLSPVDAFGASHDHLVFVYGSLLVGGSLQRTIGPNPSGLECIPSRLRGYRLEWAAASRKPSFLAPEGQALPEDALWASLTIVPGTTDDDVAGAIIGVSHEGLAALRNREVNYHLMDVTAQLEGCSSTASTGKRVSTFLPINPGNEIPLKGI